MLGGILSLIASAAGFILTLGALLFFAGRPGLLRGAFILLVALFSLNLLADGVLMVSAAPPVDRFDFWALLNRGVGCLFAPALFFLAIVAWRGRLGRAGAVCIGALIVIEYAVSLLALFEPVEENAFAVADQAVWSVFLFLAVVAAIVAGLRPRGISVPASGAVNSIRSGHAGRLMAFASVAAIVFLPFLFVGDMVSVFFPGIPPIVELARPLFFLSCVIAAVLEFSRYLARLRGSLQRTADWRALSEACGLSPREVELARLLASGTPYKEIAAALSISIPTVKSHAYSIYRKTGCPNRTALAERVRSGMPPVKKI